MALRSPPPEVGVVTFVSPNKTDRGLIEFWNTEKASYVPLDLGSPHPNTRDYPGFKLGIQRALPNDEKWIIRIWCSNETNPDWWNFAEHFSADANAYPIFIRSYRELKSTYTPRTKGSALTSVVKLTVTNAGTGYTPGTFPALTFSSGSATGHGVVNLDGTIAEFVLDSGGSGYATAPTFTVEAPPSGTTATGSAAIQPTSAVLVKEDADSYPTDSEFYGLYLNVTRIYETLPGPYIPFTRYDDNLGPIQGKRRAVLNTGQTASLTATTKTTYEGRDGSSIVSWELTETWSDGTGGAGNPAYPIGTADTYENERGAVQTTTQVVVATGTEVGSLTVSGGVATKIEYQPLEGYEPFLLKKITETWALPGPILTSTEFERDGIKKVVTRQMMDTTAVVTDEDLTAGVLTHKFKERLNEKIAFQVIETITVDDADLLDEPFFSVSIPNVIPEIFRALIPTRTESHIVAGEATEPSLELGEFERSERQLSPLYKEVRFTVLDDIGSLPITFSGIKETDENKQVVDVTLTLELDSATPTDPDEVTDVDFKKLGNGMAVETLRTVPEVFPNDSYTKSVLNLIPEKLRAAIPIVETTIDEPGSPSTDPTLLTGELSRTESRLTEFTKRTRITSLGDISLPVSISATDTTQDKQVVTTVWTLETAGTSTTLPTSTRDVSVEDLGNGLEVETVKTVPEIFPAGSYTKTILNLIPPEMRATIPITETEETSAGTASTDPTLLTGELSRNEQQVDEFNKRVRITSLGDISVPVTITALETNADKQVVTVTYTLVLDSATPAVPTALRDVEFKDLGNGYAIQTTRDISAVFPANTYTKSILNLIPEKLRAAIPITESDVTSAGTASTNPTLLAGELSRSETQVANFVKRIRVTSLGSISVPVSISATETSRDKQVVTIVWTLQTAGTSTTLPTSTRDVSVEDLGNGYEVETVRTVDEVFPAGSYTKTILNLIPAELRAAIPITESEETSAGTASTDPTLLTGELSRNEQQIDEFNKRVRITSLGTVSVPVTITALETNADKQVVTVTHSLVLDSATPATPTALRDVEFRDLGNGYAVQTTKDISAVFPANTYSKSIIDLIPAKLRAAVPMYESDVTSAGTAATTIVLLTGELSRAETQVDLYRKRVRVTSLGSISVPVILVNEELTERFGGGVVEETITLDDSAGTIDEGLTVLESSVVNLGNGYYIKVTKELVDAAWPTIASKLYDEEMRVTYDETRQVVAAGSSVSTAGGGDWAFVSEVKAIDKWRSIKVNTNKPEPDYVDEASALVSYQFHPYVFPGRVLQIGTGGLSVIEVYTAPRSALVKHTIKTWWVKSGSTPAVPSFTEFIYDTVALQTGTFSNVLHDLVANAITGNIYGPTTPSFSEYTGYGGYYALTGTITLTNGDATVTGTGTSFTTEVSAGDQIGFTFGAYAVDSVTTDTSLELENAWIGPTGDIDAPYMTKYSGGMIGTDVVIAASVLPAREIDIWKIQTESIIAR